MDWILQVWIALTGLVAIHLSTTGSHLIGGYLGTNMRAMWAPVVGLAGQPAWLWVTWANADWGMVLVTIGYTIVWARALYLVRFDWSAYLDWEG